MAFTPNVQGSRVIGSLSGITSISSVILSASTYIGLPTDIRVTGGTYSSGIATFINNTGGTFTVTGFSTGTSSTDTYVTGGTYSNGTTTFTNNSGGTFTVSGFKTSDIFVTGSTYSNNEFIFTNNTGGTFNVLFNTVTGLTSTGLINASTISATTYQNLPIDINVTGGTYNSGSILFTNNTGGTFNVTGLYTGYTVPIDIFTTGGTFSNSTGVATFTNNSGGTFNVNGFFKTSDDIYTTGITFNPSTYDLSIGRNDNTSFTQNLAILASDMTITGGTYNGSTGVATFTNNTGGTFSVNGFLTGMTDTYTTGFTYSDNTLTLKRNAGQPDLSVLLDTMTGLTVNGTVSTTTISATTYYNLPTDIRVTGGTYSNGTTTFTNNTGGTFTVSGFKTSDLAVTGGTYNSGSILFTNNTGGTFTVTGFKTDDLVVTGGTYNSGSILFTNNTGGTFNVTGLYTGYTAPIDVTVTGGTYSSGTAIFTNNTGGTFSVSGFKTDDIYTTGMTFNTSTYDLSIGRNDNTSFTQNLAILASDMTITGGTYSSSTGIATFTNNTGGTFNVSGFLTGMTDTYTTGFTYSNNILTIQRNAGQPDLSVLINTMTGLTVTGSISATTISATTFYGNGSNLTGLVTQDTFVTGSTYSNNTFTYRNNTGGTFNVLFNTVTGLTVNGNLNVTGTTTVGGTNDGLSKLYVHSTTLNTGIKGFGSSLGIYGRASSAGGTGIYGEGSGVSGIGVHGSTNSNTSLIAGVYGTSIGDSNTNIGVKGYASINEGGNPTNIGGYFYTDGLGLNNYSIWLQDGTEGTNKILVSKTSDGKANWSSSLTGLTSIYVNTISATTYQNLPSLSNLYLPLSGGTVTGGTIFTDGITANTISTVDYINFKTSPSVPNPTGGTLYYDSSENALSYKPLTNQNDVTINLGQESLIRIYNNSGTQINNGQVVHITGSTSGVPTVALANASKLGTTFADGLAQSSGVATHNIPNGEYGFITDFGIVRDLDTSTFIVGQELFLSDTIDGGITDDPNSIAFTSRLSILGLCLTSDAVNGKIYVKIENENQVQSLTQQEVNVLLGNTISTGVYEFTGMTVASTTTFNINPTRGWIVKNTYQYATLPEVTNLYYTGGTNISVTNIASADSTYVLITSALTVTQQVTFPTPQQRRENIYLGKVNHPNRTSILNINNTVDYDVSPMSALRDLWSPIKYINQGIIPSPNGANLSFNTSAGTLWGNGINWHNNQLNPNSVSISGKTPASFFYRTQTGGTSSSVTVIDPTKYEIGGVITSISPAGSNDATNQRIYLYPTGVINVLYGQTRYATLSEAVAAIQSETFIPYPNAETTGILIGVISVRNDIVADGQPLTNPDYAKFTLVSKFGESFGGTGGLSTTTLQQAYNNSTTPEIVINATLDGLTIKNGTGNADNITRLLEGQTGANDVTSFIRADGYISGTTFQSNGFIANSGGLTATTISATTLITPSFIANSNGITATTVSATTYYNLPKSTPYINNKSEVVTATTVSNNFNTGIRISGSPITNSYVGVTINGLNTEVGDGVITKDCYFSSNGTSGGVRNFSGITSGDYFMWNTTISDYDLDSTDKISFYYNIIL